MDLHRLVSITTGSIFGNQFGTANYEPVKAFVFVRVPPLLFPNSARAYSGPATVQFVSFSTLSTRSWRSSLGSFVIQGWTEGVTVLCFQQLHRQ